MVNRFIETITLVADTAARDGFRVFAPVDFLFSHRPATLAMLARAIVVAVPGPARVSSIDAEGIIGLKAQAIANDPTRRRQDEADILSLLRVNAGALDLELIRSYFDAFGMTADLERLVGEAHEA